MIGIVLIMSAIFKLELQCIVVLGFLLNAAVIPADTRTEHPHQGLLQAYGAKVPLLTLSDDDIKHLATGKYVIKQSEGKMSGEGIIIQDINASVSTVWATLLSFANYPQWVKQVKYCSPYVRTKNRIKVEFSISVLGFGYRYFIDHRVDAAQHYLRWTLDYERYSELDDVVGFWHVTQHPLKFGWTRLYYSTSIKLNGWMPGFLRKFIASTGLKEATAWVKRVSEQSLPGTGHGDKITVIIQN